MSSQARQAGVTGPPGTPPAGPADSAGARFRTARGRLAAAQKSSAAVPAYLRYVNRRLGGYLACLGYALRLTPTVVSVLSAAASLAGLVVLAAAPATVPVGFAVALATALGYALDSADGQLARVRGGGTIAGEWLDHVLDIAKTTVLHACVLITVYRHFDLADAWLLVPLAFLLAQVTTFFATMLRDALRMQAGLSRQPVSERGSFASSLILLPVDHGTLCWSFALLGWPAAFFGVYSTLAVLSVLFCLRALRRAYRGLGSLDTESPV